ncbi:methylamine utilization protein [Cellvibrio sp. NN19]|uniref:methylamine utilization protein n=1 Tax=Cellvibrio chitinivorans TaxID=3102792 RepID=UPI002B4138A5|nr:methylamine utilization protein [Cellvibrio sp. NN19]
MVGIRCVLYLALLTSLPVFSAQLNMTVNDAEGKSIKDAVVALIPIQAVDFQKVPTAIMDQREKMFVPKVLAIRVNTLVSFPNSDDIRHHVYSFSPAKKFELRLYHGLTAEPVLFDKPGTVVLGCNIHDSMVAYIYVVETDFFAVSDAQGKLEINAPAGKYRLQIYHPQLSEDYSESSITLTEPQLEHNIMLGKLNMPAPSKPADEFSNLF